MTVKVIREEPLVITSVNAFSNPEVMAQLGMNGKTQLSFPVTTSLRTDGKQLIVDGTLISKGFLEDGETPLYSASCTQAGGLLF